MPSMDWKFDRNHWYKQCVRCDREFECIGSYADAREEMNKYFVEQKSARTADSLHVHCRSCQNRSKYGGDSRIHRDEILKAQNNECAICCKPVEFTGKSGEANVDHDHLTKAERGIICRECNRRMVGVDDEAWLEKAIAYRDSYRNIVRAA